MQSYIFCSLQGPSEIILIGRFNAQETIIIINALNSCAAEYFADNNDIFFQDSLIIIKFKRKAIGNGHFCNIMSLPSFFRFLFFLHYFLTKHLKCIGEGGTAFFLDCVYGVQYNMYSCFYFFFKVLFFINFTFIVCRFLLCPLNDQLTS